MARRTITRRAMMRMAGTGALGLSAIALWGCTRESDSGGAATTSSQGEAPGGEHPMLESLRGEFPLGAVRNLPGWQQGRKYGGVHRFATTTPLTWDPTGPSVIPIGHHMNGIVAYRMGDHAANNKFEMDPDLATSWEQPDPLTFTFRLDPRAKFHNLPPVNGRALVAEDVVYAVDVYKQAPQQAPLFSDVARVEAVDQHTVKFTMSAPAAYFLRSLTAPMAMIFAREQHQSADGLKRQPIGTGPYILTEMRDNVGMKAVRNPEYFKQIDGKQAPFVDALEAIVYGDTAANKAAWRAKQHASYSPWSVQELRDLQKTNPDSVVMFMPPAPGGQITMAMRLDKPPFQDARVRQALSLSIDRNTINASVWEGMCSWANGADWSFFGKEWPWTPSELSAMSDIIGYDPQRAKQLLTAAGYENGFEFDLPIQWPSGPWNNTYTVIADQWKKALNVTARISTPAIAEWTQLFYGKRYNDAIATWFNGPGQDPDNYTYEPLHSASPKNYYFVNDPSIDELLDKQRRQLNVEERQATLLEVMKRDYDNAYRVWSLTPHKFLVRHPEVYDMHDELYAWVPGAWAARGVERVWYNQ